MRTVRGGCAPPRTERRRPATLPRARASWVPIAALPIVAVTAASGSCRPARKGTSTARVIAWRAVSEQALGPVSTVELTEARRRTDDVLVVS